MPTYSIRNINTGEEKETIMSISEMEKMKEQGEWKVIIGAPKIVTHVGSVLGRTSGDWKDKLKQIKQNSGGNTGLSSEKKKKYGFADNSIND